MLFATLVTVICGAGLAVGLNPALAALAMLGFFAGMIGLVWPTAGLLGVGILCTIDSLTRVFLLSGAYTLLRWNTFNYWLLIVMALGTFQLLRLNDRHTRWLQLLLALMLVEIVYSPNMTRGVLHVLNGVTSFGLLLYFIRGARQPAIWYWLALVTGLLSCGVGLIFYLRTANVTTIDPNAVCQSLLTAIFSICLACAQRPAGRSNVALLGLLAGVASCWVFLSGSRSGTALALGCMLFLMAVIPGLIRRCVMLAALAGVAFVVIMQFPDLYERMTHRIDKLTNSKLTATQRTHGRWDLAKAAWIVFLDEPFGVGTGGYSSKLAELAGDPRLDQRFAGEQKASHTAWLKTLSENGLPGFLLLLGYIASFAHAGWQKRSQGLLVVGLLATAGLGGAFLTTEFQSKGLWFLAAGATTLLHYSSKSYGTPCALR